MSKFGGVAAVAAGVVLLVGCGGGGEASSTTTVTETSSDATTSSTTTSSSSTATSKSQTDVPMGSAVEGENVDLTVSDVRDITDDLSNEYHEDRGTWAAMIEICSTGDWGGAISPMSHFALLDKDGGTYPPNGSTGGNLPTPQLDPGTLSLTEGQCRKGNLFFDAAAGTDITGVEAMASDGESIGTWKVK